MCLPLGAVCVAESTGVRPSHRVPKQPGHPPVCSAVDGVAVPACRTHNRDVPPASGPCKLRPTETIPVKILNIFKQTPKCSR
ncbi:hypothetical protein DPMN_095931 [Dreissena polymorpha]|uniref:Uncharacterized protein n=1 Tax=Dreissena polymorpha TaxID=45954 RepID=A0A9D4R416_DREPO|nr:hypothetical protein DPMN_095931 [Dreissena polymorpha]